MRAAVLGATGNSGLEVVRRCLEQGFEVTALVRNPDGFPPEFKANPKFTAVKTNIFNADDLVEHYKGQDVVFSCLGVPGIKLPFTTVTFYSETCKATIEALKRAGTRRFIAMTSWATEYSPDTSKFIEWVFKPLMIGRQLADMARMEHLLMAETKDLDWTTVRPAGLKDLPVTDKHISSVQDAQTVVGGHYEIARADVARFMVDECFNEGKFKGHPVAISVEK